MDALDEGMHVAVFPAAVQREEDSCSRCEAFYKVDFARFAYPLDRIFYAGNFSSALHHELACIECQYQNAFLLLVNHIDSISLQ